MKTPSYYRARLRGIAELSRIGGEYDRLLGNGHVPAQLQKPFSEMIERYEQNESNEPLTFSEITRYNTWFDMHPEKVCGEETITTSIQFPITIKGTETKAVETIRESLKTTGAGKSKISLAKAKAKALKLKLQLVGSLNGYSTFIIAQKVSDILKNRGLEYGFTESVNDYGESAYFVFYVDDTLKKVRISDHSVSNTYRMKNEIHYNTNNNLNPEHIANNIERLQYPDRYEFIKDTKGQYIRSGEKGYYVRKLRTKPNEFDTIFGIVKDHYKGKATVIQIKPIGLKRIKKELIIK